MLATTGVGAPTGAEHALGGQRARPGLELLYRIMAALGVGGGEHAARRLDRHVAEGAVVVDDP